MEASGLMALCSGAAERRAAAVGRSCAWRTGAGVALGVPGGQSGYRLVRKALHLLGLALSAPAHTPLRMQSQASPSSLTVPASAGQDDQIADIDRFAQVAEALTRHRIAVPGTRIERQVVLTQPGEAPMRVQRICSGRIENAGCHQISHPNPGHRTGIADQAPGLVFLAGSRQCGPERFFHPSFAMAPYALKKANA